MLSGPHHACPWHRSSANANYPHSRFTALDDQHKLWPQEAALSHLGTNLKPMQQRPRYNASRQQCQAHVQRLKVVVLHVVRKELEYKLCSPKPDCNNVLHLSSLPLQKGEVGQLALQTVMQ